jgi:hypothetical protein
MGKKITYKDLENKYNEDIKNLQNKCKCTYKTIILVNDSGSVGRGSIYDSIFGHCKICNKRYFIFRGSKYVYKKSLKIKKIINIMLKNNYGRCWLEDEFQGNKIHFESRNI